MIYHTLFFEEKKTDADSFFPRALNIAYKLSSSVGFLSFSRKNFRYNVMLCLSNVDVFLFLYTIIDVNYS